MRRKPSFSKIAPAPEGHEPPPGKDPPPPPGEDPAAKFKRIQLLLQSLQQEDAKFEHGDGVISVAWSPDGKKVATASHDNTCRIFDVESQIEDAKFEHGDWVDSVAWSPDGKKVATASYDNTCRIFDVESQIEDAKFEHGNWVFSVAWSPDGKKVATASKDKTCRIFDVESQIEDAKFEHGKWVKSVAWSPDGKKVATASDDKTCRIFDVEPQREDATFEHGDWVFRVAWSPDGKKVATASNDKTCRIFDVESQREDAKFEHGDGVRSVAWSPDGKKVATASCDKTCRIFDVESQREDAKFEHGDTVRSVAWSPNGKKVATASEDKTCRIFDVESQGEDANFEHGDMVFSVAWSPDGKKVATASRDGICRIFDVESHREDAQFEHGDWVTSVAWSPEGKKVATASEDNTCRIFDVESQREDAKFEHGNVVISVAWSPDGKKVATASHDNTCRIFDVESQREDAKFEHGDTVRSVAWSPDGKKVATASEDKTCRIFDVESQREDAKFEHGDMVSSVAWSPDGKKVATASDDKTCRIFDVESQIEDAKFEHGNVVISVAWSPDGKKVATASDDKTCRIFDVESQREDAKFKHGDMVFSVAWSPDGKKVATASKDKTCRIFDVEAQIEDAKFEHGNWVRSVAWSPDGKKVATASFNKTCGIFDVESQREDAKFEHGDWVYSVAWSPDGKKVATASRDKTRIWSSWQQPLSYTSSFWRSFDWQSIGVLDKVLFRGRLNMTLFGVLSYCWFFHLKGWNVPMLPLKEELQELVEGKRQKPGDLWELVCSVDAEGMSPMSLAIESGNAQWLTAYVNKDALSYLSSCDEGEQNSLSYQTRCEYLISASSAIAKLLSSQELGSLSDPLSDLLKLFVLPAEKNPYKSNGQPVLNRGNAAIQLHPLVSEDIWWPQTFDESQLPTDAGYKIELAADIFVMPQILSSDFLAQLCEQDIPDAVAVFSCTPIMATIQFKWQTWKWYYYGECIVYSLFQFLYMWVTVQGIDALSTCIHVDDGNETDVSGEDAADEADSSCFPAQVWGLKLAVTSLALLIILRESRELYAVALELYVLYSVADDRKGQPLLQMAKTVQGSNHLAKLHKLHNMAVIAFNKAMKFFLSWSFTAMTMPILVIVNVWFRELLPLQPIVACWSWLYFLYFLGGLDTTGAYVGMLWEVIKDMRSFSVVLVVVILGLGHAFSLAAHNRDTWNQLQRVYRMGIMGDFEVDDYHVDGSDLEQHHMLYLFFILITVSITVSMLNLLIAVISDTYDRVNENMVSRLNRARAARIAELERAYGKLRTRGFLMILQPAHGSHTPDWQGSVATIPKRTHKMLQGDLKDVKDAIPKTHEILHRVRELENVKGELKGELKAELKDVKDAQGKLEGELKEIRKVLEDLSDKFNLLE